MHASHNVLSSMATPACRQNCPALLHCQICHFTWHVESILSSTTEWHPEMRMFCAKAQGRHHYTSCPLALSWMVLMSTASNVQLLDLSPLPGSRPPHLVCNIALGVPSMVVCSCFCSACHCTQAVKGERSTSSGCGHLMCHPTRLAQHKPAA